MIIITNGESHELYMSEYSLLDMLEYNHHYWVKSTYVNIVC